MQKNTNISSSRTGLSLFISTLLLFFFVFAVTATTKNINIQNAKQYHTQVPHFHDLNKNAIASSSTGSIFEAYNENLQPALKYNALTYVANIYKKIIVTNLITVRYNNHETNNLSPYLTNRLLL
jgi:hypothetical protein